MEDELLLLEENGEGGTQEQKELLYQRVKELQCSNAVLRAENDMLERYISRLDPKDLLSLPVGARLGTAGTSQQDTGGSEWRRKSQSNPPGANLQLTLEQKLHVAQKEISDTRKDQEAVRQRHQRVQDKYKASIKGAELRMAEIRKAKSEFEHRLIEPMKNNKFYKKEPEKVLRYIVDKSKAAQLDKLRLKNLTLRAREKTLRQQLQQKAMGKTEHEEFFQDYSELTADKNLDELQAVHLKAQQNLSSHKKMLQEVTRESAELRHDIVKRQRLLEKLEEKIQQAEEECLKAKVLHGNLRRQVEDYQAPSIMEYVHVKDKHKKLRQGVHTWERRVAIAEMAMQRHSEAWNKHRVTLTPANSAEAKVTGGGGGRQTLPRLPSIAERDTRRPAKIPSE